MPLPEPLRKVWRRRSRAGGTGALVAAVVASVLVVTPVPVRAEAPHRPAEQARQGVPGRAARSGPLKVRGDATTPWRARPVSWPAAGSTTADLPAPAVSLGGRSGFASAAGTAVTVRAGTMPVSVARLAAAGPARVRVAVAGRAQTQAAGVNGVLLSAQPPAGSGAVDVSVDYSGFADAFGGGYAQRLKLVQLPACVLSTPDEAGCRTQTDLPTTVDAAAATLTARVDLSSANATVLAATAGATGDSGDYTATSLKPSGTWTAGNNSGDFTYSYPISVPPVAGTLAPDVSLDYDAQSVDGEQVTTNGQASWVGDGWSHSPGFIERTFVGCTDDPAGTAKKTGDECWLSGAAPLHIDLNGHSGDLVYDSTAHKYKITGDNGEVVSYLTNTSNGTYDNGYFEVVDQSGTQYFFGRNQLPGYTSGKATTNSAWTVPVYGAHANDPCNKASGFDDSSCVQAWRWNLDYVVDSHHNAIAYYYTPETNYYGADLKTTGVAYTRGGWLDHIDYGLTDPNPYTGNGGHAPAQVVFGVSERCVPGGTEDCSVGNLKTHATDWPDVPADQNCDSGATCNNHAPTFWSRKRLTSITTQVYAGGTAYTPVDGYALVQSFPAPGDGTAAPMWLGSIQHTGRVGGTVTLPAVSFGSTNLPNRVDGLDAAPAMNHRRISTIATETGEVLGISYSSLTAPCVSPVTIPPSQNTALCYPVFWTPSGFTDPRIDWFAKYVVTEIDDQDNLASGSPGVTTTYTYPPTDAAWHYDDNETVKAKYRTWGQWRGFSHVDTSTGSGPDAKTLSRTYYYRGMDGDTLPSGTRTVTVGLSPDVPVAGAAASVADTNELAGQPREEVVYNGAGGPADHATVTDYWVSAATATRTRTGLPAVTAKMTRPVSTHTTSEITQTSPTTWRTTQTDTTYDTTTGLPTVVYDHGDITQPSQATCAVTAYAPPNTGENLVNLPAEVQKDAKACAGSGVNGLTAPTGLVQPDDTVSDVRTFYDDPTFATTWPQPVPTKGDASMTLTASDYTAGALTFTTTSTQTYDSFGRRLTDIDANGHTQTTSYTMTNGLTTATAVANALSQTTTTTLDPTRGLPTRIQDPNLQVTNEAYDALGRLSKVWLPTNTNTANPANDVFTYLMQQTLPSAVTTQVMNDNGSYRTSVTLYDALLRPRQTQTQTPVGGRLVTDTYYDSHGWAYQKNNEYWDAGAAPSTALDDQRGFDNLIPNEDLYTFDGLGRQILQAPQTHGAPVSGASIRTVYGGDRTTTVPASGGTPVTTVVDGLNRTVEQDSYTTTPAIAGDQVTGGAPVKITYGFDHRGNPATVTDNAGHSWTSTFNLLGQVTGKHDPDAGDSTMVYDAAGNLLHATDSRSKEISYTYDALNRKTNEYDGADTTAPQLGAWSYDSSLVPNGIGQLYSTTSYDPPGGGTSAAYTTTSKGYTAMAKSLGTIVSIPSGTANGALAGSYTFTNTYSTTNNLLKSTAFPATGGALPAETVNYTYNVMDMPSGTGDLSGDYVDNTTYNQFGLVSQVQLNTGTNKAYVTKDYDPRTNQLSESHVDRTVTPATVDVLAYTYNPAGSITKLTDTHNASTVENQCYDYDLLGRLATAWTATDGCAADLGQPGATNATVGDANGGAYWTSYTYNSLGDRTGETDHKLAGQTADTTTAYTYPTGAAQPNALTGTSTTGPGGSTTTSYGYDTTGNTTSRTTPGFGAQTLTWNDTGRVASIAGPTGTTTYTYDANGETLLQRDPGKVTLFLPGEQLVLNTTTSAVTGTRYYSGPGGVTAVRTGTAASAYGFDIADTNGTAELSLDHTGQTPTWRQYTPYGAVRGTPPGSWPDPNQYLGKTADTTTGLDLLGARQYDPSTGRFTSLDPQFGPNDPNQIGGYTYCGDDPVNKSDPAGTWGFHIHINIGKVLKVVATVASVASIIPGPIGMVAAGVSAVAYAATGDYKDAAIMTAGLALAAVGAGAAAVVATKAAKVAEVGIQAAKATKAADETLTVAKDADEAANAAKEADQAVTDAGKADPARDAPERSGCPDSFDPATPVLMSDGTTKAIKDVNVGDTVVATDPLTGATRAEPVLLLHDNNDTDLADLTITYIGADGVTDQTVHTTQHHLFWDATTQRWTETAQLTPGDRLHGPAGTVIVVTAVHTWTGHHDMRNLTVNQTHTYYVIAGTVPVLVHNCDDVKVSPAASDWATKGAHVHIGGNEVRVFPNGQGGVGASPIRLSQGTATPGQVRRVLDCIASCRALRSDLISKASSAMDEMNNGGNWGNSVNRGSEMHFLIRALERFE